jgi:CRISPR/Cas system-associated exonuclease Cas4 (RecB family)
MVKITEPKKYLTLEAVDRMIEAEQDTIPRCYLGVSSIGEPCSRKLWYRFRWAKDIRFGADTLKRFEDGHLQEEIQADRLEKVCLVYTKHPETGQQFRATMFGGHFGGSCDGKILGLLEAPKTWHIWEHKSVNEKKLQELEKILDTTDEKKALELWDEVYYAQAVCYMAMFKMTRHFLTVSSPGGRRSISVRTNSNPKKAKALFKKAESIIFSEEPPAKLESYKCNWCEYKDICLKEGEEQETPKLNCRTCMYSTPTKEGTFICGNERTKKRCWWYDDTIPNTFQMHGCKWHMFIPSLINSEQISAADDYSSITYKHGVNYEGTGRIER